MVLVLGVITVRENDLLYSWEYYFGIYIYIYNYIYIWVICTRARISLYIYTHIICIYET